MKVLHTNSRWLQAQAKTLETKGLKKYGRSLSFSAIDRRLCQGAIIELRGEGEVVLNEDIYKANKIAYRKEVEL